MESNRRKFQPPIKATNASSEITSHLTDPVDSVCHTVLSYCSEGKAKDQCDMDTQSLSIFSGERKGAGNEEAIGELDDLLFQLDDPFSDTHSSECLKSDDPYKILDDPFSPSGSHDSPIISQEEECATSDEQIVPASPPCKYLYGGDGHQVRRETESGESGGLGLFPKRQFKVPAKSRHYNLDLLPRHYRKATRRTTTGGAKLSVNWDSHISVMRDSTKEKAGGGGEVSMSVYEVPLSAGDCRESSKVGRRSRNSQSLSKSDVSFRNRTKEEQASHNTTAHCEVEYILYCSSSLIWKCWKKSPELEPRSEH